MDFTIESVSHQGKAIEVNSLYQLTLQASASPCQRGSTRSRTLRPALRTKVDSSSCFFYFNLFYVFATAVTKKACKVFILSKTNVHLAGH